MEKGKIYANELFRVRGSGMLFNDRVYTKGDLVTGAVVGRHLISLIENGHLEPIETEAPMRHVVQKPVGLLGRMLRVRA